MGKRNNFIEINGRRFDAVSGKPLTSDTATAAHRINTRQTESAGQTMSEVIRKPGSHAARHAPKSSRTLMRHAVKKPKVTNKTAAAANPETAKPTHTGKNLDMVLTPVAKVRADRLKRAHQFKQSNLISHFSPNGGQVQPAKPSADFVPDHRPVHKATSRSQAKSAPTPAKPVKTAAPSTHHTKEAILQRALERANSHEQPRRKAPKKKSRRTLAIVSVLAFAVLAGAGLFAVSQPDTVRLALISAKAGFRATSPGQQLAGYSLSQASYGEGTVALQYGNSDGKGYTIIQKRSDLGSNGLNQQFASADPDSYTTVNAGGKEVYLYGDQKATWVQDGIWYVIQSNGSLNDQQLVDLASSL